MCTIRVSEDTTIARLKECIIEKNKNVIVKNLFIKSEQCISRIVKLIIDSHELEGKDSVELNELSMKNGNAYNLVVQFVRALAFLSEDELEDMAIVVERNT